MAEPTQGSIRIEAPPARVLAAIVDFAGYPEWAEGVRGVEVLETGPDGMPARVAFHVAMAGIEARYTLAYGYDDAGVSWTTVEASGAVRDVEGDYRLSSDGSGTQVTYRLRVEPGIALPGFLIRHAEATIVETALGGLKGQVEGTGS